MCRRVRIVNPSLQWGRAHSSAEIDHSPDQVVTRPVRASMGPRSFERGNIVPDVTPVLASASALQWGRAHSSAEMWPARTSLPGPMCPASMGPRSFERGNPGRTGVSVPLSARLSRFNGAALIRARKFRELSGRFRGPDCSLQWGRAHSSAEIGLELAEQSPQAVHDASMGPRSFERGNRCRYRSEAAVADGASMGPRSFERGNLAPSKRCAIRAASMGPRSFERGNSAIEFTALLGCRTGFNGAALIRARKYADSEACAYGHLSASMGPRSFERGNALTPSGPR